MTQLSELLAEAQQAHPMTTRQRADRTGGKIHYATIATYLRGDHPKRPDETTLQALALAFELPVEKVREAAGVPAGGGPYRPPIEAAQLSRRQRDAITELIRAIVEAGGTGSGKPAKKRTSGGGGLNLTSGSDVSPQHPTLESETDRFAP